MNILPKADKLRVAGVMTLSECWSRLERVYGDRRLNIITIKKNLLQFKPNSKQDYARIIELYEVIERGITQLSVLSTPGEPSARNLLTDDFELNNRLVSKFPWVYQREWDKVTTRNSGEKTNWDLFNDWLSDVYQEATQTKMRALCVDEDHSKTSFGTGGKPGGSVISHLTDLRSVSNKQELQK